MSGYNSHDFMSLSLIMKKIMQVLLMTPTFTEKETGTLRLSELPKVAGRVPAGGGQPGEGGPARRYKSEGGSWTLPPPPCLLPPSMPSDGTFLPEVH